MRKAVGVLEGGTDLTETFWYLVKRRLLGPPLVNEELGEQRLSKPLALGVLSPDGISSSAYGTEEILIELLPYFGLAAFTLILPMTLVVLFVLALVVLSYREIVMVYIRPGGSYVVARQNFGPRIAQVCAVALLIDYVVTVAVQTAAGTAAIASIPALSFIGPYRREIIIGVILLMCFGNLRGLREAGRVFAVPTYLFAGSVLVDDHRWAGPGGHRAPDDVQRARAARHCGNRQRYVEPGPRGHGLHLPPRVRQRRCVPDRH